VTVSRCEGRGLTVVISGHDLGKGISHFKFTVGDAAHVGLGGVKRSILHGTLCSWGHTIIHAVVGELSLVESGTPSLFETTSHL
jgi:hypothetical protein